LPFEKGYGAAGCIPKGSGIAIGGLKTACGNPVFFSGMDYFCRFEVSCDPRCGARFERDLFAQVRVEVV